MRRDIYGAIYWSSITAACVLAGHFFVWWAVLIMIPLVAVYTVARRELIRKYPELARY